MNAFCQNLLTASIHGSIVILAVMLLRLVLKRTPRKYICFLWMLSGIRLLMPISVQSSFSLQPGSVALPAISSKLVWILWACAAGAIVLISVAAYLRLQKQVKDAVEVPGGYESDKIETAFVLGFIKPKIYIPSGMSQSARKQILAHERTHLEKGDHWIKVIAFIALALHWFNPLVWIAYLMLCKDIEIACDERVVQFMELGERKAYASALLQCSTNRIYYAACPVAFGEVSVKYRIKSALSYRKPAFLMSLMGVLAVAFVTLCLLTNPAQAASNEQAELWNRMELIIIPAPAGMGKGRRRAGDGASNLLSLPWWCWRCWPRCGIASTLWTISSRPWSRPSARSPVSPTRACTSGCPSASSRCTRWT